MNNIFEFNQNDWLWIFNISLFTFCLLDGVLKGKEAIAENITNNEHKINKNVLIMMTFIIYFLTMYVLYFVFFDLLNQTLSFIILFTDVIFRIYNNTINTKSLSDYDNK